MILFLEYSAGAIRGGEVYNLHFHSFLKSRFSDLKPFNIQVKPSGLSNPFRHILYSLNQVKKEQPEMIVLDVSSGMRNILAVRWMKKHNKKVLLIVLEERLNLRSNFFIIKWLVRYFEKYLIRKTDYFLTCSKYSASLVTKKGASANSKCIIAYPGVDRLFLRSHDNAKNIPNAKDCYNLLFVGVCKSTKGIIYLVKAINMLKDLNINLNIVGSYSIKNAYYRMIKEIIEKNKLDTMINFHGYIERDSLIDFYLNSDIYVHPSLMEGYGLVLAEALTFGLPIVASKTGAIPEMVEDGVNALLVEPGNPHKLAEAIRRLCQDSELRDQMSRANLEKAKTLPTWNDFYKVLDEQLIPLLKNITTESDQL